MMLTLNDGRSELWQWDTGRTLAVDADCSQVHFSNKVFGRSIDVDVVGGTANIPDVLLQTDKDLNVWAFVGTAENGYTKISKTFKVNRRNKPADYVFTPPEQTTLAELVEQIGNLDELTTKAKDNLVAAINEAAKTGSGEGGISDHSKLNNRNADDQHPMSAITGLVGALGGKMDSNNPVGTGSFSMGRKSDSIVGKNSHAEGDSTIASGPFSHAEGNSTTASGYHSHAEGYSTIASGSSSHAEGISTTASSGSSHAEGYGSQASGDYSHAEGHDTKASGTNSHAEGHSTIASCDASHAQGKYNIKDSSYLYAHIVGNGTSDTARSNAHTLDWSGNAWYAGDVFVGSASGTNKDDGSKKLATEEYVNNEIADCIKAPATASVGQTIVVKAVDETGKPTEWEAADMEASVDIDISRAPDLIIEVAEAVVQLSVSEINGVPINTTEMVVLWEHPGGGTYMPNYFRFNNEVRNGTDSTKVLANWNLPRDVCPTNDTAAAILSRVKKVNDGVYIYEFFGSQQNPGTINGISGHRLCGVYRNILGGETSIKEFFVYQATQIQPGCKVSVWIK